jgi:hypothetical protein
VGGGGKDANSNNLFVFFPKVLAIWRGEEQKELSVKIALSPDGRTRLLAAVGRRWQTQVHHTHASLLAASIEDAFSRLMQPRQERAIRSETTTWGKGKERKKKNNRGLFIVRVIH